MGNKTAFSVDTEYGLLKRHSNQLQLRIPVVAGTDNNANNDTITDATRVNTTPVNKSENNHQPSTRRYPQRLRKQTDFYGTSIPIV